MLSLSIQNDAKRGMFPTQSFIVQIVNNFYLVFPSQLQFVLPVSVQNVPTTTGKVPLILLKPEWSHVMLSMAKRVISTRFQPDLNSRKETFSYKSPDRCYLKILSFFDFPRITNVAKQGLPIRLCTLLFSISFLSVYLLGSSFPLSPSKKDRQVVDRMTLEYFEFKLSVSLWTKVGNLTWYSNSASFQIHLLNNLYFLNSLLCTRHVHVPNISARVPIFYLYRNSIISDMGTKMR